MLPPLVLTGGPAVGKSTTARRLARERPRAAVLDVDDLRQLVTVGGAAPWEGPEGVRQQRLGVLNACAVASNFLTAGFDVVIADVLDIDTCALYRELLPSCLIVRLVTSWSEALRRAATRQVFLTDDEFAMLHRHDGEQPPPVDVTLQVDGLSPTEQGDAVASVWLEGLR